MFQIRLLHLNLCKGIPFAKCLRSASGGYIWYLSNVCILMSDAKKALVFLFQ